MPSSHPAMRPDAIARFKARLEAGTAVKPPAADRSAMAAPRPRRNVKGAVARVARRAVEPVLVRAAGRVADDVVRDVIVVRSEVERLADELARTRSALEAELALIRAELASYRDPS